MAAIKKFTELKFSDFFMFAAAMKDEEICKGVLERVLGIPIKKVKVHSEHSLLVNSDHRESAWMSMPMTRLERSSILRCRPRTKEICPIGA